LPRVAFSTLAFPDATLASAVSLGRRWGYAGVELRLIDGELIDPSMPAAERARVGRALAGLPVVAVDSSIRLTDDDSGPVLRRFLQLASDLGAPLVRVFGGVLPISGPISGPFPARPARTGSGPRSGCSSRACRWPGGSASPSG
jgi:sugar phosphate isomerase/epimerase